MAQQAGVKEDTSSPESEDVNLDQSLAAVVEKVAKEHGFSDSSPEEESTTEEESPSPDRNSIETEEEKPATEEEESSTETEEQEEATEEVEPETKEEGTTAKTEKAVPYERFKEVTDKVNLYKPLAEKQQMVESYLRDNNISQDEFIGAVEMAALVKVDPKGAASRLREMADSLEIELGSKLPPDLAAEVENGAISEERAKEIVKLRSQTNGLSRQTQLSAQQLHQQNANRLTLLLQNWMANKGDPYFKQKSDAKAEDGRYEDWTAQFSYLVQQNAANGINDNLMIQLAEQAYQKVLAMHKRFAPKPKTQKVLTASVNGSSKTKVTKLKSAEDVAEAIARKWNIK